MEAMKNQITVQKWTKKGFSGILVVLSGFLILYAYYLWLSRSGFRFLGFEPASLDPLLPYYYVVGVISFVLEVFFTFKAAKVQMSSSVKGIGFAGLTVFSSFLIYEAYHTSAYRNSIVTPGHIIWINKWSPLHFIVGLITLVTVLIMIFKTLKDTHKLTGSIISAILISTGSFFLFDAYDISIKSYQLYSLPGVPGRVWEDIVSFMAIYHWLPLYIAVASVLIVSGLAIVYKTFKFKMHNWTTKMFSIVLMLLGGFVIFYTYSIWIVFYESNVLGYAFYLWGSGYLFSPNLFGFSLFSLYQSRLVYFTAGFTALVLGQIVARRASESRTFDVTKGIMLGSITAFGGYLIYDAYHSVIGFWYIPPYSLEHDLLYEWRFVYFLTGLVILIFGQIITHRALSNIKLASSKTMLSVIFVTTGAFFMYDAYRISVSYHEPSLSWGGGTGIAYHSLHVYIAIATLAIMSGLVIMYETLKATKKDPLVSELKTDVEQKTSNISVSNYGTKNSLATQIRPMLVKQKNPRCCQLLSKA